MSETLSSTPAAQGDTDMASVNGASKGRTYVWGGVAVAVALGVGLVVVLSSGPKSPPTRAIRVRAPAAPTATVTATAVTPTSPTAVAPTTSTAAGPVFRQVRVESDPTGASVSEGDTQLCSATPCELTWKDEAARAEHKLTVTKKGYKNYQATR